MPTITQNFLGITNNITQLIDMIQSNGQMIEQNREDIDNNKDSIDDLSMAPLGTIIAWVPKPSQAAVEFIDLPDGWVRCDGSLIPPSGLDNSLQI